MWKIFSKFTSPWDALHLEKVTAEHEPLLQVINKENKSSFGWVQDVDINYHIHTINHSKGKLFPYTI